MPRGTGDGNNFASELKKRGCSSLHTRPRPPYLNVESALGCDCLGVVPAEIISQVQNPFGANIELGGTGGHFVLLTSVTVNYKPSFSQLFSNLRNCFRHQSLKSSFETHEVVTSSAGEFIVYLLA